MGVVHRIFAGLFCLVLLLGALLVIALVTGGVSPSILGWVDVLQAALTRLPTLGTGAVLGVVAVAALVLIVCIYVMLRVFTGQGESPVYRIREDESGELSIRKDAIVALSTYSGRSVPNVEEVVCRSRQVETGEIIVHCRLVVRAAVDLVATSEAFGAHLREEIEGKTGLKVAQVNIVANYRSSKPPTGRRRVLA
jgi:hypothetical protein